MTFMVFPLQPQEPITLEGCNTTKGCFRYPPDCYTISTCSYFLSWTVEGGRNKFEMAGDVGTYVAFGFSKSGFMVSSVNPSFTKRGLQQPQNSFCPVRKKRAAKG